MNWPTVIVLLVVLAMVVVAIRVLRSGNGTCSCGKDGKKPEHCSGCASCSADCPFKR